MYVRVYAPDGEVFDVARDRADRLILENGWTQSAPSFPEAPVAEEDIEAEFEADLTADDA